MSGDLTDKTMVVVTRLGDFWVNPDRAMNVAAAKQQDPQGTIEMDGSFIGCQQIDGILTAFQYDDYNRKRNGQWQCKYKTWHAKFEQCACARNQHETFKARPELTDEEREKASAKLAEIRKSFGAKKV